MSTQLDRELREALEDLASARPPAGLADHAVRRAVRRRRTMRTASVTAGLAVVATIAATAPWGRPAPAPTGQTPPETQGRFAITQLICLPDGAEPDRPVSLELNRQTGTYESLPYSNALPSPDGSKVAVVDGTDGTPARVGVIDTASRHVEWIPDSADTFPTAWSPDGGRLALQYARETEGTTPEYALVDAADPGAPQRHRPETGYYWDLMWAADGATLLVLQVEAEVLTEIVRVGPDGRRRSAIPVGRSIVAPGLLTSTDGTRVLALTASNSGVVIDTATGVMVDVPLAGLPLGWVGNEWLVARIGDGQERRTRTLGVIDLAGSVVSRVPVPCLAYEIIQASVRPSTGLAPDARRWAF
jgi:hypothetical protein